MASQLFLRVLTASELQNDDVLVPALELINASYKEREAEGLLDRYSSPEVFLQDIGTDGLCAIVQDREKNNLPGAVAVAKQWKGQRDQSMSRTDGRDWEIGPAASRNLPQYRQKGLIERCLQSLSVRLLDQAGDGTVRLWVMVVEELYSTYWARRGFEQYGSSYVVPVGEWHRDRSYTLIDMKKEISRERDSVSGAGL
ncbi:hypothetical protein RBB50_004633 [Rhinocladiella similis]